MTDVLTIQTNDTAAKALALISPTQPTAELNDQR